MFYLLRETGVDTCSNSMAATCAADAPSFSDQLNDYSAKHSLLYFQGFCLGKTPSTAETCNIQAYFTVVLKIYVTWIWVYIYILKKNYSNLSVPITDTNSLTVSWVLQIKKINVNKISLQNKLWNYIVLFIKNINILKI